MFSYNGYCFSTINEVADNILSSLTFSNSAVISGVSVLPDDSIDISYFLVDTPLVTNILNRSFPSCSITGNTTPFFGLTIPDSIELTWLMVAAIAAAWSVKVLRRAL